MVIISSDYPIGMIRLPIRAAVQLAVPIRIRVVRPNLCGYNLPHPRRSTLVAKHRFNVRLKINQV
jgi:hypothetical protein